MYIHILLDNLSNYPSQGPQFTEGEKVILHCDVDTMFQDLDQNTSAVLFMCSDESWPSKYFKLMANKHCRHTPIILINPARVSQSEQNITGIEYVLKQIPSATALHKLILTAIESSEQMEMTRDLSMIADFVTDLEFFLHKYSIIPKQLLNSCFKDVYEDAHRLKGEAYLFNYPQLGYSFLLLEYIFKVFDDKKMPLSNEDFEMFHDMLTHIKSCLPSFMNNENINLIPESIFRKFEYRIFEQNKSVIISSSFIGFCEDYVTEIQELSKEGLTMQLPTSQAQATNDNLEWDDCVPTVLIADDSVSIRAVIKSYILSIFKCNILEAENGIEAETLIQERNFMGKPIDYVFLDWMMPKQKGIDVLKNIRALEIFKEEPKIIMLTAETLKENELYAKKLGCNAFVRKPFNQNSIISVFNSLLQDEEIQDAA